jgi:hypothetical protein
LESSHCSYHQTLKQKSQSGLSSRETAIEKSDAGNDQPHDEAAKDQIRVMVFEPDILCIDIDKKRISPFRFG